MRINQQTSEPQFNNVAADRSVAGLSSGGFVATWTSYWQVGDQSHTAAVARLFDADGIPVGDEFVVNETTHGPQRFPTVAVGRNAAGEERILIVWETWQRPSHHRHHPWESHVYGRLFDADGNALGGEFRINEFGHGGERRTGSVDFLPDGSFVVAWFGKGRGAGYGTYDTHGVFARKFDESGNPLTGDVLINQTRIGRQQRPSLQSLPSGEVLFTWDGRGDGGQGPHLGQHSHGPVWGSHDSTHPNHASGPGDYWGVFQRRFDANLNPLTDEERVNSMTWGPQSDPSLSVNESTGEYAIGFAGRHDVYLRLYNADGTPKGPEAVANSFTDGHQREPAVAWVDDRIVATWSGDGPGDYHGVFKREFDKDGVPLPGPDDTDGNGMLDDTAEVLVNVTVDGPQHHPAVAALDNGGHVVTWSGNGVGDDSGVFKRLYEGGRRIVGDHPQLVFVIDRSGSTSSTFGGTAVGDVNGDGSPDTILDAELAGLIALNQAIIADGNPTDFTISIVIFDDQVASLDVDPMTVGTQLAAFPNADADANGVPDIEDVLRSITIGGGTIYGTALQEALNVFNQVLLPEGDPNLIFLSDGFPGDSGQFADEVAALQALGANLLAFGIGTGSSLTELQVIDPNAVQVDSTDAFLAEMLALLGISTPAPVNAARALADGAVAPNVSLIGDLTGEALAASRLAALAGDAEDDQTRAA
jgi:hypothetical protein